MQRNWLGKCGTLSLHATHCVHILMNIKKFSCYFRNVLLGMRFTSKYEPHHDKPAFAICEQQRHRSACAFALSDQHLCCSLLGQYNTSTCYIQNFKTLASLWCWADRFESYLVGNPKDRFSRDMAHITFIDLITGGYRARNVPVRGHNQQETTWYGQI